MYKIDRVLIPIIKRYIIGFFALVLFKHAYIIELMSICNQQTTHKIQEKRNIQLLTLNMMN